METLSSLTEDLTSGLCGGLSPAVCFHSAGQSCLQRRTEAVCVCRTVGTPFKSTQREETVIKSDAHRERCCRADGGGGGGAKRQRKGITEGLAHLPHIREINPLCCLHRA